MSAPALRIACLTDAPELADLARRTFHATFVEGFQIGYPDADLAAFFEHSYALQAVEAWIANPLDRVFVLEQDGALIGYAHAGSNSLPSALADHGDGELKRLYLSTEVQGQGFGRRLLEAALTWLGVRQVFIGVWRHNAKAIELYQRYGFEIVGNYGFMVGRTRDEELILARGPKAAPFVEGARRQAVCIRSASGIGSKER